MPDPIHLIYFPNGFESRKIPYIIFSTGREFEGEVQAVPDMEDYQQGRYGWYKVSKCRPFSKRLWNRCQRWAHKKAELEEEYKLLMKKNRRRK